MIAETTPLMGPAPRRSALRENRSVASAETVERKLFGQIPPLTPALLRLDPMFDPLRNGADDLADCTDRFPIHGMI
jgi:hypothetical protein